jgi:hypothetical protein
MTPGLLCDLADLLWRVLGMLLNTGAAANAVHPPKAAEAFKNHLRETFSSFDTKEIKLSLKQGVVKLPAANGLGRRKVTPGVNPELSGSI